MMLHNASIEELERELSKRRVRESSLNFAREIGQYIVSKLSDEERCHLYQIIQDDEMFAGFCRTLKDAYDMDVRRHDP